MGTNRQPILKPHPFSSRKLNTDQAGDKSEKREFQTVPFYQHTLAAARDAGVHFPYPLNTTYQSVCHVLLSIRPTRYFVGGDFLS